MSDLRPSRFELDDAAQLLASARARLSAAAADLALPNDRRLSDRERAVMGRIAERLTRLVEDELRSALAEALTDEAASAALSSAQVEIAGPILEASGVLTDRELVEILLRRAEEHRLHRFGAAENALLVELAGDPDEEVAAEAMDLLIAQSSRLDGFDEPVLARSDLPAELEHQLVWTLAAALRRYMVERHSADPPEVDAALSAAAARVLANYDEGEGFHARAARLALLLRERGRLDDSLLLRALTDAGLPFFVASLCARSGFDAGAIWEMLVARSARGIALLLRAAGVAREEAGAILLALGNGATELPPQLDLFDSLDADGARRLLTLWAVDPGYRAAVARLA